MGRVTIGTTSQFDLETRIGGLPEKTTSKCKHTRGATDLIKNTPCDRFFRFTVSWYKSDPHWLG